MNTYGLLDVIGIVFTLVGGIIPIMHIQNLYAQTFTVTCLMFGIIWLVFAFRGLPVKLHQTSRLASTNGVILFTAVLVALSILIVASIYNQNEEVYQWWFYLGVSASYVGTSRLLYLYWWVRKYGDWMMMGHD